MGWVWDRYGIGMGQVWDGYGTGKGWDRELDNKTVVFLIGAQSPILCRYDTGTSETQAQTGCTVEFKQRHKQHKESFEDPEVNQTCLSQHIWKKLKQTQLTFLTLLFGVRLVVHLHTIQQLGCANFASWKNITSWMIQMGQASTRGVNFFETVITNILNYLKISISIFQITKKHKKYNRYPFNS